MSPDEEQAVEELRAQLARALERGTRAERQAALWQESARRAYAAFAVIGKKKRDDHGDAP